MAPYRHAFKAMAAMAEIQLYANRPDQAGAALQATQCEVERIEAKYSRYRDDSVTSAINRGAGAGAVAVDPETSALLDYADACWRQSDGLFDITSGTLRRVWDFTRSAPPEPDAVRAALRDIGWDRVRRSDGRIALPERMEIDFGGIGKEYAADRAAAVLLSFGIADALVNLGGDIRAIGTHAGGMPWQIGIAHPRDAGRTIAHVSVTDSGLATSGDYERFFIHEGRRYSHVLNPKTGWPIDGPRSVSVIAPLCIVAGTCATVAMLKEDRAEYYLREQSFPYLLIDRDGNSSGTLSD